MMNPSPLHSSIKKVMLMDSRLRLSAAIAAILGASAARLTLAATASPDNSTDEIQEITVTAQRRSENMQDVPITIQAMTQETLAQLNVTTFDDFIKFLPNVTESSTGPGARQHIHAWSIHRK
jgi:iron complex outermembrane receptor protein